MDKKILITIAKQAWGYIISYFTQYLLPIIKDAFDQTKEYFINTLWDSLKDQFLERAESAVLFVETYFNSCEYKEKEEEVMSLLFKNLDLPLPLKPFKPLIKKLLKKKVRKLISDFLKKFNKKS